MKIRGVVFSTFYLSKSCWLVSAVLLLIWFGSHQYGGKARIWPHKKLSFHVSRDKVVITGHQRPTFGLAEK